MVDERIGTEVAGFRIRSVLGHGGMGTVYVAEQTSPRRRVALKLLRPDLSADEAFRRRFEHESEAAASTEHPNIVPIYASGEADGVLYIAMRYVEGSDLRERIARDGAMPPDRAAEVVTQVAGALDAAHRRGLVHRDVKPGNILLDEHGNAYLTDFGLIKRSEVSSGITKTGQFMGSIEYCAPEQIRGEEIDGRADVYSLACVLYECVAGRPPFRRDTEIATLYAHLEQAPPPLPPSTGAPAELDRVLATGMAKRPSERYGSAGELARDARQAVGVSSGERAVPPRRPRRLAFALGAAAVLVALVIGAAALRSGDEPSSTGPVASPGADEGADEVVRLDTGTGEVVQTIGGFSAREAPFIEPGLAVGEGGVWVTSAPQVYHLDPSSGTIRATIFIQQSFNMRPSVDFRTVWVTTGPYLHRVNPATDELLRRITLIPPGDPIPAGGEAWIATGEGGVWVANSSSLYQVDPLQARLVREIDVGSVNGLAVGEGGVWVIDNLAGSLTRLDPASGEPAGSVEIPGSLGGVTVGGDRVWILDEEAGTLTVVDATSLAIEDTIRVGGDEQNLVFGAGAVWLADGDEASVSRVDPLTRQVTVFPIGTRAKLVAVGSADEVWVLVSSVDRPGPADDG